MAKLKFARGKIETLSTLPLADGQLILIEDIPEWLFDIADDNGDLHRFNIRDQITLGILNDYIQSNEEQLESLRKDILTILATQVVSVNGKIGDVKLIPEDLGLENVDNTADIDKPVSTAQQDAIHQSYSKSAQYTDDKISDLINGAPTTLNTLNKLAEAITENQSAIEDLDKTIGTKASKIDLEDHTGNNMVHITQQERDSWNSKVDSTAVEQMLNGKYVPVHEKGQPNGIAILNDNGKVPLSQLPESHSSVTSVNGHTGAVEINAEDINALPIDGGILKGKLYSVANSNDSRKTLITGGGISTIVNDNGFAGGYSMRSSADESLISQLGYYLQGKYWYICTKDGAYNNPDGELRLGKIVAQEGATFSDDITIERGVSVYKPIKTYEGDQYGMGIVVGAGGRTIIGAGESGDNLRATLTENDAHEVLYMTSDQSIQFFTNCNTIANRKNVEIDTSGKVIASGGFQGNLIGNADTATTANQVKNSLTFTGATTGTWNGSAAKTVNIPSYSAVTTSANGLMTADDKKKLDSLTFQKYQDGTYKGISELIDNNPLPTSINTGVKLAFLGTYNRFMPERDDYTDLGGASYKWDTIYASTSTIYTSDKKEKHNISYIGEESEFDDTKLSDEQVVYLIERLLPVVYKLNNGTSDRPHHGLIAQDVETLLEEMGIDHACFIKSPKEVEILDEYGNQVLDEYGVPQFEIIEGEYIYGLRYEELISDILRYVQIKSRELNETKTRLTDLENRFSRMEQIWEKNGSNT